MPFLRFNRDRRGYETTALLHAFRRQGRSHPRILYWFRSPVDARVGRAPIDEDAIRLLEENHPGVQFDWPRILQLDPAGAAGAAPGSDTSPRAATGAPRDDASAEAARRGRKRRGDAGERTSPAPSAERPPAERAKPISEPSREPATAEPPATPEAIVQATLPLSDAEDLVAGAETGVGGEPEVLEAAEVRTRRRAADEMFSVEDLARLRGRHAALLARIDQEVTDAEKAEALRAKAEALNPDTWVTPDAVRDALEHYEQVYRELRDALGRRRSRKPAKADGSMP